MSAADVAASIAAAEVSPAIAAVVAIAFCAESMTGFGGTVITVTLGAQFLPLDRLLPLYVPVNCALSAWIAWRDRRFIAASLLGRRILPSMAAGMAVGLAIYRGAPPGPALLLAYAALVAALAVWELARRAPVDGDPAPPLSAQLAALIAGGVIHGLYGSGGPLVVWASSRELRDKSALRATLAVLWLGLGAALIVQYASLGQLGPRSLVGSAALVPVLVAASWVGQRLHDRVAPRAFRRLVHALLLAGALSLAIRHVIAMRGA